MADKIVKIYGDARFLPRRDTLENWQTKNPILLEAEPSYVIDGEDGKKIKFGDGVTPWNDLPYLSSNINNRLNDLESRVRALESNTQIETPTEEYLEFVVGKWHYNGDKCSFGGKNYTCTAPTGTVCVWSPTDYPAYWEEV